MRPALLPLLCPHLLIVISAFKPFHISEEGRTVASWDQFRYHKVHEDHKDHEVHKGHKDHKDRDLVVREYVLREEEQRSYLLCPRGFVIGQVSYALLLGDDQIEKNRELRHKRAVYKHKVGQQRILFMSLWLLMSPLP